MAQVHETEIVVRLSKLYREGEAAPKNLAPKDFTASLEALAGELIEDKSVVVEVIEIEYDPKLGQGS